MISRKNAIIFIILSLLLLLSGCKDNTAEIPEMQQRVNQLKVELTDCITLTPLQPNTHIEIDWAYPFVRWNNSVYKILTESTVPEGLLGQEIGKVKRDLTKIRFIAGKEFEEQNGDSSYLRSGSKLYRIIRTNPDQVIAVYDHGVYRKAINLDIQHKR